MDRTGPNAPVDQAWDELETGKTQAAAWTARQALALHPR